MKSDRYFFLTATVILAGVLTAFLSVSSPSRPANAAHEIHTVSVPVPTVTGS